MMTATTITIDMKGTAVAAEVRLQRGGSGQLAAAVAASAALADCDILTVTKTRVTNYLLVGQGRYIVPNLSKFNMLITTTH